MNDEMIIEKFKQSKIFFSNKINSILISQARSKLEKELAKIIIIANNHLNKGKSKGDPVFNVLWEQACNKIADFCTYSTYKQQVISDQDIYNQLPALADLKAYTIPDKKINTLSKFVLFLCLSPIFLGLIGFAAGIISYAYHLLIH